MNDQINIKATSTDYEIILPYHSDLKCENYDAKITGTDWHNGKISITPHSGVLQQFEFAGSDPDRVIAIAKMMIRFAQEIKNKSKKTIDISDNL